MTEVAVKRLNSGAGMDLAAFRQEAAVLASCRDPHVCQFLGACFRPVRGPTLPIPRVQLLAVDSGDREQKAHGSQPLRRLVHSLSLGDVAGKRLNGSIMDQPEM